MKKQIVCIITGPCGAGKSTISKDLADTVKRSARIDVDILREEFIRNGYASPWSYKGESKKQVDLCTKNSSLLALNFLKAGFNVFIDDVLERNQQVLDYLNYLKPYKPQLFLLLPNKKVLARRDKCRSKKDQMGARAAELHDIFTKRMPEENWHVLDTSNHTVKETKKEILKLLKK